MGDTYTSVPFSLDLSPEKKSMNTSTRIKISMWDHTRTHVLVPQIWNKVKKDEV